MFLWIALQLLIASEMTNRIVEESLTLGFLMVHWFTFTSAKSNSIVEVSYFRFPQVMMTSHGSQDLKWSFCCNCSEWSSWTYIWSMDTLDMHSLLSLCIQPWQQTVILGYLSLIYLCLGPFSDRVPLLPYNDHSESLNCGLFCRYDLCQTPYL